MKKKQRKSEDSNQPQMNIQSNLMNVPDSKSSKQMNEEEKVKLQIIVIIIVLSNYLMLFVSSYRF